MLKELTNTLIDLGVSNEMAQNLEMLHHRFIRSTVENQPTLKRVAEFMEDYRDEYGNELADLAIAHGAVMHLSRTKNNVDSKAQERIGANKFVQTIVAQFQTSDNRPEYDYLAVNDEDFDL